MRRIWKSFIAPQLSALHRDQRGSVESALVIVPTLILFLIGFQIAIAAHARNITKISAQDQASVRAISGEFEDSDEFIHIDSSGESQNLDLLIARQSGSITNLIPTLLDAGDSLSAIEVTGIAIVENQR